nr:MAG TPA: hypothetical protein [Caudoviricetes sp.]
MYASLLETKNSNSIYSNSAFKLTKISVVCKVQTV